MVEVLEFVFQDFWHWFGTFLLLSVMVTGIADVIRRR